MNKNYYQILGLNTDCSKEEIKKAYRNYAIKFHPDKHNNDSFFEERFKEIKEAYDFLMNDFERNKYNSTFNKNNSKKDTYQTDNSYQYYNSHKTNSDDFYKKQREKEELERLKREKIEKRRKTLYYADDKISINGLNLFVNNFSYKIDDIDYVLVKKNISSDSKLYAPILILLGVFTLTFIIGIFFLAAGIAGLFHKEYVLLIHHKENDIPVFKGKKKDVEKISMNLNFAIKNK